MTDAVIVILADHAANFVGEPSSLMLVLRATVERVRTTGVPIAVCHRDVPANGRIAGLVTGVQIVPGPAGTNDAALVQLALEATGARDALVIDGRWPFVSVALARAQLAAHRASGHELTFASMAATGLAGVAITRAAAERLAVAAARWPLHFDTSLFDLCDALRPMFTSGDVDVPPELVCMPVSLACATYNDVERLEPFLRALAGEDYTRVLDAECRAAWGERTPGRTVARPKLLVTAYSTSGEPGATVALEILLAHLEGFDVTVALPNRGALYERLERRFPTCVLPIHWRGARGDRRWSADVVACSDLLRAQRPDLVYINGAVAPMAVACRAVGVPSVAHLHLPILRLGPYLSSQVARQTCVPLHDAVITPARTAQSCLQAAFRPPPGRVVAIECGISTAHFDPARHDPARARDRFELPRDAQVIGVIGMLVPIKQPEVAVETLVRVRAAFPRAMLVFAGAERLLGGYQQRLEELAAARGVADRVRFLGHVADVPDVYAASDIVLHCAVGDTFPLVLLEAMAMARPVVALADGGATESVADGVTGRLVAMPGCPEDFAAAIAELLENPSLAARMGARARERAIERYNAETYARRIRQVCERVIAGAPIE